MRALKLSLKIFLALLVVLALVIASLLCWYGWQAGQRETAPARELAPATGRYITVAPRTPAEMPLDIFVQELGPPDGPAVLMVHGTGAWSDCWRPAMKAIADAGFHAIAIDLPPFGFSQRPASSDYSKAAQGRRIAGVLDALKIERAILVGHSFGGGPTMEAALQIPGRTRGIVLVDAALSVDAANENLTAHEPASGVAGLVLAHPFLRDRVVASFLTNPQFTHKLLTLFIDNPDRATEEWVGLYRKPLSAAGTTPAISNWLPELIAPVAVSASEKPSTYKKLTVPLRLIWGERDNITPLAQGQAIAALAPNAQLQVMPGIGHIPQIENTAEFNKVLVDTLKSLPGN